MKATRFLAQTTGTVNCSRICPRASSLRRRVVLSTPSTPSTPLTPLPIPLPLSRAYHCARLSQKSTASSSTTIRSLTTSTTRYKGIQPTSSDPAPPKPEGHSKSGSVVQLSDGEYHELADQYLDRLVYAAEELSENQEEGWDTEFSAGVLTISHMDRGSWVINKQPPNKQIWLSSPESGPKRYDWVMVGAGQHEKEGSAVDPGDDGAGGKWIYLRDGSGLSDLLHSEVGVVIPQEGD
ncbi:iron donor protein CyaY [Exophiala mesophila]|uniref:ferroxidase n=1 Tax=Exophiala mesophila TaxID=212818 RepID=A0A0D1ZZQ7_EXOME|nr:iron donor protein CyaY [Exophiala mesophila]KIV92308.1 iron donor protein CyaY [Exophiala mesophila]